MRCLLLGNQTLLAMIQPCPGACESQGPKGEHPPITTIARPTDVEEKEKTDSPTTDPMMTTMINFLATMSSEQRQKMLEMYKHQAPGKAGEERPDVHLQCQITAILMMSYFNDVHLQRRPYF